jgi:8-oxo-dGTP pyrophosphatase MutT (NUDIX family)
LRIYSLKAGCSISVVHVFWEHVGWVRFPAARQIFMRIVTLCLLMKEKEILLAMKKRGFGEGKWNGVGGKVEKGEEVSGAAIREVKEEIGVDVHPDHLEKIGSFKFYFKGNEDWNQEMHIFTVRKWIGEPTESDEMRPKWYTHHEIPFPQMWLDDAYWLPKVLRGKKVSGEFHFDNSGKIIEKFYIQES